MIDDYYVTPDGLTARMVAGRIATSEALPSPKVGFWRVKEWIELSEDKKGVNFIFVEREVCYHL